MSEACEFGSLDEANEILGLMMRHWNNIAATPPHMAAGLLGAYQYFRSHRQVSPSAHTSDLSQRSQGRAERAVSVWFRQEVQAIISFFFR